VSARYLYLARHGAAIDEGELSDIGRRQAELLGKRLAGAPLASITHGPLPRAAATAAVVSAASPGVPCGAEDYVGDYVPFVPAAAPSWQAGEAAEESLAAAALERFARPADEDVHELVVTHSFLVAWFVRDALGAPPERWIGINSGNAALTVIRYSADRAPGVLMFNDMAHLPVDLRWTGFPAELRSVI
jgi:probable phosphoglycerate mutase